MLLLYICLSVEMDLVIKSVHGAKWKNASGLDDLSSEVSKNGQNKYLIFLILLSFFCPSSIVYVHACRCRGCHT